MILNKVVHVPAYFSPKFKEKTVKIPTGEKKKGFFGEREVTRKEKQWVQTGFSDCEIDSARLTQDLEATITTLNEEGYEVVSITPITSGAYSWEYNMSSGGYDNKGYGGYGYGYGYSYTDSLILIAKKVA